ncbi:MAG: DUF2029 domain-containing protein [Luteitalea sp.]|nr:DUF2029 domain-containing protein [Luteitalea sp.]
MRSFQNAPDVGIQAITEPLLGATVAILMAMGFLFVSQAVAWRLGGRCNTLTRWTAVLSVLTWSSTALFHLLISQRAFARWPALAVLALLAGAAWKLGVREGPRLPWLRRDRVFARRAIGAFRRSRYRFIVAAFVLCALPPVLRALILPPLGWDALTYHTVKAAMWVQHGELGGMNGPGPWAYYRNMPGGSEVIAAWTMLPTSSDAFVALVEVGQWLAVGLATMTLARQIGVREPFASTAAGFVMTIPTVRLMLGSGYSELCLLSTFLAGLALGLAAVRNRPGLLVLAGGALGVSAATKLPMLVITFVPLAIVIGHAVLRGARHARTCAVAAAVAYGVAFVPWLVHTTIDTGLPLSPVPIQLGPIALGKAPPEVTWYLDRPVETGLRSELSVVREIFAPPGDRTEALGLLAAVPLAGTLVGFGSLWRRRRLAAVVLAVAALCTLAVYFSPGFAVIRHHWTENSSRFLLTAAASCVVLGVAWCHRRSRAARLFTLVLAACALWNLAAYALVGFSEQSGRALVIMCGGSLVTAAAWRMVSRVRRQVVRAILALCLALAAGVALQLFRDRVRAELLRNDFTIHGFAGWRYWSEAATHLDDPALTRRIAVTSGPWQAIDNWFVYPFMGRRLQNEVTYVPVSGDGRIRHFGHPDTQADLDRNASAWAWQLRLQNQQITHVVSFRPASIELAWMEANEDLFEPVAGRPGDWGVFRVRTSTSEPRPGGF